MKQARTPIIRVGVDVYVTWPTWEGVDAWDVWDARRVTQGATKIATCTTLEAALAIANEVRRIDLSTPEGREDRNRIMRDES